VSDHAVSSPAKQIALLDRVTREMTGHDRAAIGHLERRVHRESGDTAPTGRRSH
jgi:hypothetical protein